MAKKNFFKKTAATYAIALMCVATAIAQNVEINEQNFPDANFRAWLMDGYNIGGRGTDGILTPTEIADITWINVFNKSISDLSGIEYFTALDMLDCRGNQLKSLDVSACVNLQALSCDNNQLTSLEVSGLTNLKNLSCAYNQFTSFNVSSLKNLQGLTCNDNQLTSLDVSGLTNLQSLYCISNQLKSLDLSTLTNLQYLSCSENQLSSLGASALTNLQYLWCSENQLISLDVSGLTNLQTLYCYNNQLTSLDVSTLTNLGQLLCNNNQLTSLDISGLTIFNWSFSNQNPTLTLTSTGNNYSAEIALNNPNHTIFANGISYADGKLISNNNTIESTLFEVDVLGSSEKLSGTFTLEYEGTISNISDIKTETCQAVGFYSIMGVELDKEPQSGLYIVKYANGKIEKVVK